VSIKIFVISDNDEKASDHLYSSKPSDQEEKLNKRDNKAGEISISDYLNSRKQLNFY
jgi:hypothetical protein